MVSQKLALKEISRCVGALATTIVGMISLDRIVSTQRRNRDDADYAGLNENIQVLRSPLAQTICEGQDPGFNRTLQQRMSLGHLWKSELGEVSEDANVKNLAISLHHSDESTPSKRQEISATPDLKVPPRSKENNFPNFSRHGPDSLIRKYLTEAVYNDLKDKETTNGVCLDHMIRGAVSLPWGAKPPRGIGGVYAGDAESYQVFAPLLDPLIEDHHHADYRLRGQLRRHRTNLNPRQLLQQRLDPDGQYILYTRMRLARSIEGFRFSPCISVAERRQVEAILKNCIKDWKHGNKDSEYISVMNMTNEQHQSLLQRQLLFPDPDPFALCAGTHRDWPDARGVYCDDWQDPKILIWCNGEDHLWIISNAKGGDVQGVFTRLSTSVWALETSLEGRGHAFVEDKRLGFLNASPTNIGPALRASVFVKLVRLGRHPDFENLIRRLKLEARVYEETDRRYTGIFDIANSEALGKSEVELINVMIEGVGKLIELEKSLENGDVVDLNAA
jgi:protein-arginine kinase